VNFGTAYLTVWFGACGDRPHTVFRVSQNRIFLACYKTFCGFILYILFCDRITAYSVVFVPVSFTMRLERTH